MATVTKSIGTSGRDYSTIAAWDADLDNASIYSSNDTGQGECYADSALSQSGYNQLEGGMTVGLSKVILTVPVGQRHDGTADSGAKVNLTNGGRFALWYQSSGHPHRTIEWLELDGGDSAQDFGGNGTYVVGLSVGGQTGTASHLLMHGCHNSNTANVGGMINSLSARSAIFDNIIYDCSGVLQTVGIKGGGSSMVCNNTVYKLGMTYGSVASSGARTAIGIQCPATCVIKNNIAIGTYFAVADVGHEKYDYLVSGTGTVGTYNLSGDSTASGSDSITGVSTASLFISTTSGSEDLHILRSSKAVGAGDDLGTSVTSGSFTLGGSTYGSPINRDINNGDRNSRAMAWDIGASQQSIISTIGATGREYSTVAAWEADLDDDTYYGNGSIARGEMYPDSTFSTNFGQVGGGSTIGLVCKVLTAAAAYRHDGTESGSHVKVTQTAKITHAGAPFIMSWLDISGSGGDNQFIDGFHFAVTHCIIHDVTMSGSGGGWPGSRCVTTGIICNNIIYNIDSTTTSSWGTDYYTYLYGIWQRGTHFLCDNNTVYKVHSTNSWGGGQFAKGIVKDGSSVTAGSSLRNNIVVGTATDTAGTNGANAKDFNDSPTATFTNNLSSDGSADGSNSITDTAASALFISNAAGSEDLHLKLGAAAIGAGADLGTTYSTTAGDATIDAAWDMGPQYDINYGNRDAFSQTWDIGASQYAIIATIGTNSRDYSTITAWEADLDDASYYGKGSVANGQMYKDSDYQYHSTFTQNGGGTLNLFATYLTVAEGQRHDGTPNTGVRFLNNGSYQWNCMIVALWHGDNPVVKSFEWVEMDLNGKGGGGCTYVFQNACGGWGQSSMCSFNHCMIHNYYMGNMSAGDKRGVIWCYSQYTQVHNNLLFNIKAGNPSGSNPFLGNLFGITSTRTAMMANNTIYGLKHVDSTSGEAMGIQTGGTYDTQEVYNNICVGNETQDFHDWGSGAAVHSHNLSSDSSATGTGAVTGKSAASLFVSTTTGSEDLSLIPTAPAIGVGKDLGTKVTVGSVNYGGEGTCLTHLNRDIFDGNRHVFSQDWDIGANQYEIKSKIGSNSRDYSTIAAWEADLDNTDYYGRGSKVRGECYDDSDFSWTSSLTIDGGGTVVLGQLVLSVAAGQRHDGTAKEVGGSGVRLLVGADHSRLIIATAYGSCSAWVEWLDFDGNNYAITTQSGQGMIYADAGSWYSAPRSNGIANCIVHDNKGPYDWSTRHATSVGVSLKSDQNWITNCIIYNIGAQWYIVNDEPYKYTYGLYTDGYNGVLISNITIYNIFTVTHPTSTESNAYGWTGTSYGSNMKERNIIAARVYGAGNINKCFQPSGPDTRVDYNLSTDDSAPGSNSVHDVDYNDLFVSTSAGAEDLLLKDGSPALGVGDDMGNGPIVFNAARPNQAPPIAGILPVDIKGRDRHAEDDETWDIGAHQCDSCSEGGATGSPAFLLFLDP